MKLICTTCDGLGEERREITHLQANVYGWHREALQTNWYRRRCQSCKGEGFVDEVTTSVPQISSARSAGR